MVGSNAREIISQIWLVQWLLIKIIFPRGSLTLISTPVSPSMHMHCPAGPYEVMLSFKKNLWDRAADFTQGGRMPRGKIISIKYPWTSLIWKILQWKPYRFESFVWNVLHKISLIKNQIACYFEASFRMYCVNLVYSKNTKTCYWACYLLHAFTSSV